MCGHPKCDAGLRDGADIRRQLACYRRRPVVDGLLRRALSSAQTGSFERPGRLRRLAMDEEGVCRGIER
jgi:hypothetical protein